MRRRSILSRLSREAGQSLIETALTLPILLLLAFNAINFGYFFFVALNLTSAPRSGVQYAILGPSTPQQLQYPPPGPANSVGSVSYLTYQDMRGVLPSSSSALVQVCSSQVGIVNPGTVNQKSACTTFGTGTAPPGPQTDPEAPAFLLSKVDVVYTLQPLI
ncbi:MAG: pilus assembly protein, partial [Acidobacteria bacterium]|nr:pilus assembly protein [Acidobacteriota bacterium]